MGKKYIIELEDKPFHKGNGVFLYRVKGFNSLVFDMNGVGKLTPYAEPDLEQVKADAYNDGYKAGREAEKVRQKIRQPDFEQKQEEFHVGDEFENGAGQKFVVLKMYGKEIDRYIDGDGKTYVMDTKYSVMRKTGRSFPEIAVVLEKMRESE